MNREPATETQLRRLEQLGYKLKPGLTREEAAHLLHEHEVRSSERSLAQLLCRDLQRLKIALAQANPDEAASLRKALTEVWERRLEFWVDTCRNPIAMHNPEAIDLYRQHGCRFEEPTHEQVKEVLEALDAAATCWELQHPELFYQTLELNFRELVRC